MPQEHRLAYAARSNHHHWFLGMEHSLQDKCHPKEVLRDDDILEYPCLGSLGDLRVIQRLKQALPTLPLRPRDIPVQVEDIDILWQLG